MAKRSTPKTTTKTTTTKESTDMPDTTTDTTTTTSTTPDTIEAAVDAFLSGDAAAIERTVATLKGGARTAASGRAVQHAMAAGVDPAQIGSIAAAVQEAIEATRSTPAARPTLSAEERDAVERYIRGALADVKSAETDFNELQTEALVAAVDKLTKKVSVVSGQRRTISYDWSRVAGQTVTLKGDDKTTGVMTDDGQVIVGSRKTPERLSPAAERVSGQKSVRGTQAWILEDGQSVGDAAAV